MDWNNAISNSKFKNLNAKKNTFLNTFLWFTPSATKLMKIGKFKKINTFEWLMSATRRKGPLKSVKRADKQVCVQE